MKTMKNLGTKWVIFAILANQLYIPGFSETHAAQGCFPATLYYGVVTVDGIPTDNITVGLTNTTINSETLSTTTTLGGNYMIDAANFTTCPTNSNSMNLTATFTDINTSTTLTAINTATYSSAQAMANIDLQLLAAPVVVPPVFTPVLTSIDVSPVNPALVSGSGLQLSVIALDQSGGTITPTPGITWTSDNTGVLTVDNFGMVTGVSAGTGMITATAGTVSGTTLVTVTSKKFLCEIEIKDHFGETELHSGSLDDSDELSIPNPIVIHSDDSHPDSGHGHLSLSGVTLSVSGGTWNGRLLAPIKITRGSREEADDQELAHLLPRNNSHTSYISTILQTIKAGGNGTTLYAHGANFRLSFLVAGGSVGQQLKLFRSTNGDTWEENTPNIHCTLDNEKMCTFETDHLSYFAPVVVTTQAVSSVPSGGGGGSITRDYCPAGDVSSSYYDGKCTSSSLFTTNNTAPKVPVDTVHSDTGLTSTKTVSNVSQKSHLLGAKDISKIESLIQKVPEVRRLNFLNIVLGRIDTRIAKIQNTGSIPTTKDIRMINLLLDIKVIVQEHMRNILVSK